MRGAAHSVESFPRLHFPLFTIDMLHVTYFSHGGCLFFANRDLCRRLDRGGPDDGHHARRCTTSVISDMLHLVDVNETRHSVVGEVLHRPRLFHLDLPRLAARSCITSTPNCVKLYIVF